MVSQHNKTMVRIRIPATPPLFQLLNFSNAAAAPQSGFVFLPDIHLLNRFAVVSFPAQNNRDSTPLSTAVGGQLRADGQCFGITLPIRNNE
jgi:hypothetical protein